MSIPENALDQTSQDAPVLADQDSPRLDGITTAAEIPDKLFFRIGDVAKLAGIKPYVLRFWETEFPGLGPRKSGTGHRLYRRKDVEMVLEIKRLLYEQRFTIEGARKFLETRPKSESGSASGKPAKRRSTKSSAPAAPKGQVGLFGTDSSELLEPIRKELLEILKLLK
jgi:DNA-binding transcriptional MerR regulator